MVFRKRFSKGTMKKQAHRSIVECPWRQDKTSIVKWEHLTNRNPQQRVTVLQDVGEDRWGLEHPMKDSRVQSSKRPRFRTQEETRKDWSSRKDPTDVMVNPTAADGHVHRRSKISSRRQTIVMSTAASDHAQDWGGDNKEVAWSDDTWQWSPQQREPPKRNTSNTCRFPFKFKFKLWPRSKLQVQVGFAIAGAWAAWTFLPD